MRNQSTWKSSSRERRKISNVFQVHENTKTFFPATRLRLKAQNLLKYNGKGMQLDSDLLILQWAMSKQNSKQRL